MINYHARWVLPVASHPVRDGTVRSRAGKSRTSGSAQHAPAGEDVDLGDAVLMPGLVNAHTHLELTAMRGLLDGMPFVPWIRTLTRGAVGGVDRRLDAGRARWGIVEGLVAGITTYADTSASGVVVQALNEMHVRGIMYQEIFGPSPDAARIRARDAARPDRCAASLGDPTSCGSVYHRTRRTRCTRTC